MQASVDSSPIPSHAVTCWADDNSIYVALPMTAGGIPYITRYPKSEGGLAQALAVLCKRQPEAARPTAASPADYTKATRQPMVKLTKADERLRSETTEAQRENARKVLAKLGIK